MPNGQKVFISLRSNKMGFFFSLDCWRSLRLPNMSHNLQLCCVFFFFPRFFFLFSLVECAAKKKYVSSPPNRDKENFRNFSLYEDWLVEENCQDGESLSILQNNNMAIHRHVNIDSRLGLYDTFILS